MQSYFCLVALRTKEGQQTVLTHIRYEKKYHTKKVHFTQRIFKNESTSLMGFFLFSVYSLTSTQHEDSWCSVLLLEELNLLSLLHAVQSL